MRKISIIGLYSCLSISFAAMVVLAALMHPAPAWATHAATANGEIEGRPAPVFRRICLGGTNAGDYCKENAECPGSSCFDRNIFNITVAVRYDAPAADITKVQNLITAMSASLFDTTDGQAQIGTATIHNNAISTNQADLVIHPSTNDTWWQANSGHYRTGGFMEVSINYITNPANQGVILAHEFTHLVFDARDEYESRAAGCGAVSGNAACPVAAAGDGTCLMDGNGTELCWGQGDPADLTDLTGGNHDPSNVTEQSVCRGNRSCWDQVSWSWPTTFRKPAAAPDPAAGGAVATAPNFVVTSDAVRVVLVLDESGSMSLESPSRIARLKVAANDFIATAENNTELGIVSYASNADTTSGRARVAIAALGNNRANWTNAVNGLNPSTRTNIGAGLRTAQQLITDAGGVTANTYIVLMTDGLNNEPSPQATAAADLQDAIDDLLAANIPVYVTCTGGDLGLQSQCAEIGTGTGGFYADSANPAKMPENFVDFHERITGHQAIDSVYGNFAKLKESGPKTIYVDEGSASASFALLWEDAATRASLTLRDPNGTIHQTREIPQGRYARISNPVPGEWQLLIDPSGSSNSNFVARGYTHNRINGFNAALRKPSVQPNEELYLYAIAKSRGGSVTKAGEKIIARVTRPDGTTDTVELFDNGRDAGGHGDDLAGDGIFTGVYTNTALKGAYQFQFKTAVDGWLIGEEAHQPKPNARSPKFMREVTLSAGVSDPRDVVVKPEDDHKTPPGGGEPPCDNKQLTWLIIIVILLLLIALWMIWRCCCARRTTSATHG